MTHDPLCPYIEDTDGVVYAWNECECDLIAAVRNDQTKILNTRVQYQSGYADGYRDALEAIRDASGKLFND
jgi:hypothetical protein